MSSIQIRVKFPADYPVIYKTVRLDGTLTVLQAIEAIGQTINHTPGPDVGLYLPNEKASMGDNQTLNDIDNIRNAEYIELKSKKASSQAKSCCLIM
ncbi:hypothetical protein DLAC_09690 [Tieghemostelium lacteum]|uniref:Ubiquitin-like domain-containing protein n=1 Tax=Tieghemostelium lacteum TaxID=361077 RepID=A0A151Z6Y4_TIELA|nr:hypothetical protein DLAC_09690 [Tieghemostelium lacteum]|eukprot:KYQ89722.1 hypothetical protein DLAC_09690 [Tieghemostelium lacteum]